MMTMRDPKGYQNLPNYRIMVLSEMVIFDIQSALASPLDLLLIMVPPVSFQLHAETFFRP